VAIRPYLALVLALNAPALRAQEPADSNANRSRPETAAEARPLMDVGKL
jgi:hypothetical protein